MDFPPANFIQFVDLDTSTNVAIPMGDIALLEEERWMDDMSRWHITTVVTLRGQERRHRLGWTISQLLTLLGGQAPEHHENVPDPDEPPDGMTEH